MVKPSIRATRAPGCDDELFKESLIPQSSATAGGSAPSAHTRCTKPRRQSPRLGARQAIFETGVSDTGLILVWYLFSPEEEIDCDRRFDGGSIFRALGAIAANLGGQSSAAAFFSNPQQTKRKEIAWNVYFPFCCDDQKVQARSNPSCAATVSASWGFRYTTSFPPMAIACNWAFALTVM
jgi:hypothetical protein